MTRIAKEGKQVRILKQYRNMSNNYKPNSKIWADLYKVCYETGETVILDENELEL